MNACKHSLTIYVAIKALLVASLLGLMVTVPANAQFSFGGDGPLDIKAEKAVYKGRKTTLVGNVEVLQDGVRIISDEMDIFRENLVQTQGGFASFGDVERIDAKGNFQYETDGTTVTGDRGVYLRDVKQITVTGNVAIRQANGNIARGNKLVYDLESKRARLGDTCVGETCPNNGRVTIDLSGK